MKGRTYQGGKHLKRIRESLDIPLDDHPIIPRIRTQPPWSQQVLKSYFFLSHYLYSYTSTYYSITTCGFIWCLLVVPFYWYSLSNGTRTLQYALICQGPRSTHNTTIKSGYLHGSSAPRTYSIICIGSESCLWSIVGLPGSYACYLTFRYIG